MADLGVRANVMGPQPMAQRRLPPDSLYEAANRVIALLRSGGKNELLEITEPNVRDNVAAIADSVTPGAYAEGKILGVARTANHYFVNARLTGSQAKPMTIQFRLGENEGRWTIREALNLTGVRSGWSK